MQTVDVFLRAERTMPAAVSAVLGDHAPATGRVAILPASMEASDPVAEAVRQAMPRGVEVAVVTPLGGAAARRAFFLPRQLGGWREVRVEAAGASIASVLLPDEVVGERSRIVAVDVVEVARHGPFVLDVLARYVHPRQRLRLVADRQRSSLVAEVASAALPALAVVSLSLPGGALVAVTPDPIVGELVALALAERCVGTTRAFTGPWEDAVVQRATELRLGVTLPAGIRLHMAGDAAREPWAIELVDHLRQRLGLVGA